MPELINLEEVLLKSDQFSWKDSLFLSDKEAWNLYSKCAVINMDDLDDEEEVPDFAKKNNLIYAIGIQQLQDIVDNALIQRPNCSNLSLFKAFLYYYQNDAFIDFDECLQK